MHTTIQSPDSYTQCATSPTKQGSPYPCLSKPFSFPGTDTVGSNAVVHQQAAFFVKQSGVFRANPDNCGSSYDNAANYAEIDACLKVNNILLSISDMFF